MNKLVQRLIKVSLINRNWLVLSTYSTTSHVNFSPDSLASRKYDDTFGKDRGRNVPSDKDATNLLRYIQQNYVYMDRNEITRTLHNLYKSVNNQSIQLDAKNIEGFEHMCNVIQKEAKLLSMYDTVCMLNILTSFKVPSRSTILTTLLQLLATSVDKLSIGQLIAVHAILNNMKEASNVQYLRNAVTRTFIAKAATEVNVKTPNLLKILRFCTQINDVKTIQHIINILSNNNNQINIDYVVDIYYAMSTLPELSATSIRLLFALNNMIINNSKTLKAQNIIDLIRCIADNVQNSRLEFYREDVMMALTKSLLSDTTATYRKKFFALFLLNKMQYSCPSIIDNLINESLESAAGSTKYLKSNESTLIDACVIANYEPSAWEKFKEHIRSDFVLQDYSIYNGTSIAFRLLSLECYQPELLEKVFKLCNNLSSIPKDASLSVLRLHWCVKTLYTNYEGVMLDEKKLNELDQFLLNMEDTSDLTNLRENLEQTAGGAEYVKHGLRTKFGEFVDVVVVQPDGSLMNTSNLENITFAEELTSFPDCTKILFFALPTSAFSVNEKKVISTVKMLLKTVESLPGFSVNIINPYKWKLLTSKGKVEHLQEVIKSKCNSISTS